MIKLWILPLFALFVHNANCILTFDEMIDFCGPINNLLMRMQPTTVNRNGCRNTRPMEFFDPLRIAGKWYAFQMYNFAADMIDLACSADYFIPTPSSLNYTGIFLKRNGTASQDLSLEFPLSQFVKGEVRIPGFRFIRVVDTDYSNYILWHACVNDPVTGREYERIDMATRTFGDISPYGQFVFNRIIDEKIFNNTNPFSILPFGRCNCLFI